MTAAGVAQVRGVARLRERGASGGSDRRDAAEERAAGSGGVPPAARFEHQPVMIQEVLQYLAVAPGATVVDATVGGGGHAEALLTALGPEAGWLIGVDQDPAACRAASDRLAPEAARRGVRMDIVRANFGELDEVLDDLGLDAVDGVLFDLGVSSPQLDQADRGFSYREDAPLDMRMDPSQSTTAYHLVNGLDEAELATLIARFGEERWARRIAAFIVRHRQERGLIATTGELVELVKAAVPAGARRGGPHPARRTFQALRIAVNNEIGVLHAGLHAGVRRLRPGGRIVAVSFHSLEDRAVKSVLRTYQRGCVCPPDWPECRCGRSPLVRLLMPRPVVPGAAECAANPRARSAKLRAAERLPGDVPAQANLDAEAEPPWMPSRFRGDWPSPGGTQARGAPWPWVPSLAQSLWLDADARRRAPVLGGERGE